MLKNRWWLLVLIVGLAVVLRWGKIGEFPPAVNWDEVSHGYNAYAILKTGKDEWGKVLPIFNFRAYGDYPLALNLYLTIPFIWVWGLSEWSIRLPHAILGVGTVVASYVLAWGLTKKQSVALLTSALVAVGPWYVFPSHFVTQSNLSVFLLTCGMACFFNRSKRRWLLPLAVLFLGLTLLAYHTTRIFTPLLVVALVWMYRDEWRGYFQKSRGTAILAAVLFLIFFAPLPFVLLNAEARARSQWVFLVDQGAVNKIIESRLASKLPGVVAKLVYNRPTYFVGHAVANYVGYFSPKFLFWAGGTNYQLSLPGEGLEYLVNLPFFYLGLYLLWRWAREGKRDWQLVLVWLLVSPLPASVTKESFAVLRASTMLPLPEIFVAVGLVWVWGALESLGKRKWVAVKVATVGLYGVGMVVACGSYLTKLGGEYAKKYDWAWQYGYRQAVDLIGSHYADYDRIYLTKKYGEPHEFLLFFWPWDPESYRNNKNLVRYFKDGWYWVDSFDKFQFVNDWEISDRVRCGGGERCVVVTSPNNYPREVGWEKKETISYLSGSAVFEILEKGGR